MNKCQFCVVKLGKQELCDDCLARYDAALGYKGSPAVITATSFLDYTVCIHFGVASYAESVHGLRRWGFILDLSYEVEDL